MRINWLAYDFHPYDGYGRFGRHMVKALLEEGVDVNPIVRSQQRMPDWMLEHVGIGWDRLTIACLPPYMLRRPAGRCWAYSMTEGTDLPAGWGDTVNEVAERLLVPCAQNADAFRKGGVTVPIHVVPGGTSPEEFPVYQNGHVDFSEVPTTDRDGTYTFLAMGDRGGRKGWPETWQAWWAEFGDDPNARLVIKSRAEPNSLIQLLSNAENTNPRITFWNENVPETAEIYRRADCIVLPSRSEGWGMPHREAAMMGLPVIVSRYSGLDDGHTDEWAVGVVETLHPEPVPSSYKTHMAGEWMRPDEGELATAMRWCYENREEAAERGKKAAHWLRENQTWRHSARRVMELVETYG